MVQITTKKLCKICEYVGYPDEFVKGRNCCIKCHKITEKLRHKRDYMKRRGNKYKYYLKKEYPNVLKYSEVLF